MELHQASNLLATAGADGCIRLWRLPQLLRCTQGQHAGAQAACWAGHGASITACCFTHCGRFLASAGRDGTVRLWQVSAQEPLAVLQLHAASLAFAPGDDAALLVAPDATCAAGSLGHAPVLLSLRSLPACQLYCSQLDAASRGGSLPARSMPATAAVDSAAAVWLPSGTTPLRPRPAHELAAAAVAAAPSSAAAPTPDQPQPSGRTPSSGGGSEDAGRRQVGRLATFGRRRRQPREQQQQTGSPAVAEPGGGSDSWLPPDDTPVRPPLAASSRGMHLLASPRPPSPLSPASAGEAGLEAAVLAVYDAPLVDSHSKWETYLRAFVPQHGGHAVPVSCILPLLTGLHVLTADDHGIAKLWRASGGSGRTGGSGSIDGIHGSSYSTGICCTLLPRLADQHCGTQRCRPLATPDGRHVLCGMPSGHVVVWETEYVQHSLAAPPEYAGGNSSAYFRIADCEVTAVAWDDGCHLLCCGDAAGHLSLRWL